MSYAAQETYFEQLLRTKAQAAVSDHKPYSNNMASTMMAPSQPTWSGNVPATAAPSTKASSRFQQLLKAKLAAEQTEAPVQQLAVPHAMDFVQSQLQSKDTVVNTSFARQSYVETPYSVPAKQSDPIPIPQLQRPNFTQPAMNSLYSQNQSPISSSFPQPAPSVDAASSLITQHDHIAGVYNSDQLSARFRDMVNKRIADMYSQSQANSLQSQYPQAPPAEWMQQVQVPRTPVAQIAQLAQHCPEVKMEPEEPLSEVSYNQSGNWQANPSVPFDSYQSAYPFMWQDKGRCSHTDEIPHSCNSSTSSLPSQSPQTPRQSTQFLTANAPHTSHGYPVQANSSKPQQPSSPITVKVEAPIYGPAKYMNMNGMVQLPTDGRYVGASSGQNGGGPSDWTNPDYGAGDDGFGGDLNGHGDLYGNGGGDNSLSGAGGGGGEDPNGGGGGNGDGDGGGDDDGRTPKKKLALACHFCRRRKLKCDGIKPLCENCRKRNETCTWDDNVRRRGPGKRTKEQREKSRRDTEAAGLHLGSLQPDDLQATADALAQVSNGLDGAGPSTLAELGVEPDRKRRKMYDSTPVTAHTDYSDLTHDIGSALHASTFDHLNLGDVDLSDPTFDATLEGLEALHGIEGLQALQSLDGALEAQLGEGKEDDHIIDPTLK